MMKLTADLDHPLVAAIEEAGFLRTVKILPVVGDELEVHIGEAHPTGITSSLAGIRDTEIIDITSRSALYAFRFGSFVSYCVTDETFIEIASQEVFVGRRLRSYSSSHFLDYVSAATWATSDFPGHLMHFQLNTLDHTIDVVTAESPELVLLDGN